MTQIEEAKAKLDSLLAEERSLRKERDAIEARASEIIGRLSELAPSFGGWGEIRAAKEALANAERDEADAKLPTVVFVGSPPWSHGKEGGRWVVDKVTPKRIFIREAGSTVDKQYLHDGTEPGSYQGSKIDIAKTFPNGLPVKGKKQ
jgi:hypothetical protein